MRQRPLRRADLVGAFLLAIACGDDGARPVDASVPDASMLDASMRDASMNAEDAAPDAQVEVTPAPADRPHPLLSDWGLFEDLAGQVPSAGVVPYAVNAELFADETDKHRYVWIPQGGQIEYRARTAWRFPVGTILVKTFSYARALPDDDDVDDAARASRRLLETRLLVRGEDRWHAHAYVYDPGGADAARVVAGRRIAVRFIDAQEQVRDNRYAVPNTNQCHECHGKDELIDTLGGVTRQLNRQAPDIDRNQVERFIELGLLRDAEPAAAREALVDPFGTAPLIDRMRAYADANCGHCHNSDSKSGDDGSGLWLRYDLTDPAQDPVATLGICKMPQSASGATCGHRLDVVPGDPQTSILICRLASEEAKVQMPPLGRNLHDVRGVALMTEWIENLEGTCR